VFALGVVAAGSVNERGEPLVRSLSADTELPADPVPRRASSSRLADRLDLRIGDELLQRLQSVDLLLECTTRTGSEPVWLCRRGRLVRDVEHDLPVPTHGSSLRGRIASVNPGLTTDISVIIGQRAYQLAC